ncbi:hypothetical protein ACFL9T_08125 [Thermodesulfobacteriota bacterium]
MDNIDVVKILSYGTIGLGFLLALLAYFLLSREQKKKRPRSDILKTIKIFLLFFLLIIVLCAFIECYKIYQITELEKVKNRLLHQLNYNSQFIPTKVPLSKPLKDFKESPLFPEGKIGKVIFSSQSSPKIENGRLILTIPNFKSPLTNLSIDSLNKYDVIKNIRELTDGERMFINKLLINDLTIYVEATKTLEVPGFYASKIENNILIWR